MTVTKALHGNAPSPSISVERKLPLMQPERTLRVAQSDGPLRFSEVTCGA